MRSGLFLLVFFSVCAALFGCMRDFPAADELEDDAGGPAEKPRIWSWPADGESATPRRPERLLFGSELEVAGKFELKSGIETFELSADPIACGSLFEGARSCYELEGALERIAIGPATLLAGGESVASFVFVDEAPGPLELLAIECGVFEERVEGICVDRDDRSAILRGNLSRSARVELAEEGAVVLEGLAPGGRFELEIDLRERCERELRLAFIDLFGETIAIDLELEPHRSLPELHLIESLADPIGPEPAQEYLVLYHAGAEPASLDGYRISDSPFRPGDPFPAGAAIAPGARALLVSDLYDPAYPGEPSPPPASAIIRFSGSITSNGLANQGEPIYLIDPEGRRVSAMPRVEVREGSCLLARSIEDRRTNADRFLIGECTGGSAR